MMEEIPMHDGKLLIDIVTMQMPFGKYKGTIIKNLPVSYLEWFQRKGFPQSRLGKILETLYEIKINGLEHLLWGISGVTK
ncbi:MAG: DUF3820 family protein [Ferruginibacter sp.]